jgi:hypothetical protein
MPAYSRWRRQDAERRIREDAKAAATKAKAATNGERSTPLSDKGPGNTGGKASGPTAEERARELLDGKAADVIARVEACDDADVLASAGVIEASAEKARKSVVAAIKVRFAAIGGTSTDGSEG